MYKENNPSPSTPTSPMVGIFFDESWWLEQSWERVTEGTLLTNYIEIDPLWWPFVIWMVDVTIINNLIPGRASFDHFFTTHRKQKQKKKKKKKTKKKKKCITVFDESTPNFRSWKKNKLFWPFWIF